MSDDKIALLGIIFLSCVALMVNPSPTQVTIVTAAVSGLLGWLKGYQDGQAKGPQ